MPRGVSAHAPKSMTPSRPSGRSWKLPGCGLLGLRVLHLHRDRAAVVPDRLVHLPDTRRRDRLILEVREAFPPRGAQLQIEHAVGVRDRHGRGFLLQAGQRRAEMLGEAGWYRGLGDAERLAELHGSALELAQHREDLVGGIVEHLVGDAAAFGAREQTAAGGGGPLGQQGGGDARHLRHARDAFSPGSGHVAVPFCAASADHTRHPRLRQCKWFSERGRSRGGLRSRWWPARPGDRDPECAARTRSRPRRREPGHDRAAPAGRRTAR